MTDEKRNRVHNARCKLRSRPRNVLLRDIAAQSGLSLEWLSAFARGKYPNPHEKNLSRLEKQLPTSWVVVE